MVFHQKQDQQIEIFDSLGRKPHQDIRNLLISSNRVNRVICTTTSVYRIISLKLAVTFVYFTVTIDARV